jgi:hypothetical protein
MKPVTKLFLDGFVAESAGRELLFEMANFAT